MGVTKMAAVLFLALLGSTLAQETTAGGNLLQQALNIDPNAPGVPSKIKSVSVPVIDVAAANAAVASVDTDPTPEAAATPEVPTEAEAAVPQPPATPEDSPAAEPTAPPRRRNRRAASDLTDASISAQFLAPRPPTTPPRPPPPPTPPTPVTSVTCKIDAQGNVADVIVQTRYTESTGCTSGGATAVFKGGYNVVLDFSDSGIVQVVQGKLSTAANAPVAWLGFRTDSADMRTCGNVRPSSANAVISKWGTIYDRDLGAEAAAATYRRDALYTVALTCTGTSTSRRMSGLSPTAMSMAFVARLPDLQPLVTGMPPACTSFFNWPYPVNVPPADESACVGWLASGGKPPTFPANPVCPAIASPNQWSCAITKAQLPASRPFGFSYRRLSTAKTNITVETLQPPAPTPCEAPNFQDADGQCCAAELVDSYGLCRLPPNTLDAGGCYPPADAPAVPATVWAQANVAAAAPALSQDPLPSWITAKVEHMPIPGVSAAMMYWWFNGNIDGDMLWNGVRYPRYLLWHPRDHVSQDTINPGPTPGTAEGAYWSMIEFLMAPGSGYTRSSKDGSWSKNYMAHRNIKVQSLTPNSVELVVMGANDKPITTLVHTWSDMTVGSGRSAKPALALTSTLTLGRTLAPGANVGIAGYANAVAWKVFGGDCPLGAANAWVQHTVEEMGNLEYFLPKLYRDNTGSMG